MQSISIFDIFKIGIGPSSSHTLGPWKAARLFRQNCVELEIDKIDVHLYGSLSKTGRGHATHKAILLGLLDYDPKTIQTDDIDSILNKTAEQGGIEFNGSFLAFSIAQNVIFENLTHHRHPNTILFHAYANGEVILEELYASVGGGFIEKGEVGDAQDPFVCLPYPIEKGTDLLTYTAQKKSAISDIVLVNEIVFRQESEVYKKVDEIYDTMLESVYQGCITGGILPGGLKVKRRAKDLCAQFTGITHFKSRKHWIDAIKNSDQSFNAINKWISCFALAVNEQNASLNRVVTSPTNGAAGVIPAVLLYHQLFCDSDGLEDIRKFLFTAGEIGCLFKKGATISAAVGGCQAEIGVSSAMAAAGLTEVMGGSPRHCLMAAEIAMEHHLGMTCDPIGGLVQVPCIERNALGAIKAITASNIALMSNPDDAIVHIDTVIKTMWDTAQDMHHKYKESSEGGLAFHLPVVLANC